MIAVVANEEILGWVNELNTKGLYEVVPLHGNTAASLQKNIESTPGITHVIIDIEALRNQFDAALDLMERLYKTKLKIVIIAVAIGENAYSTVIKDIKDAGVQDIICTAGAGFKRELNQLLLRDGILGKAPKADEPELPETSVPESSTVKEVAVELSEHVEPAAAKEPRLDKEVPLPSVVPRAVKTAGRKHTVPPPADMPKAITIAFAGLGPRIGTTTQAMQMALYIKAKGAKVCVMQFTAHNSLSEYITVFDNTNLIDAEQYQIADIDIFRSGKNIAKAKMLFDYVICDYGNYLALPDVSAFLDKDIKIIVAGAKPWELQGFDKLFEAGDSSVRYIFSFVPQYDQADVKAMMEHYADKTYFAPYTPDYWDYSGTDDIFSSIISLPAAQEPAQHKKKGFLGKLLG